MKQPHYGRQAERPILYTNQLGHKLKLWRNQKISLTHCYELLRLYLGYEFIPYIDNNGRYPRADFNQIRKLLRYKSFTEMLDDIERSGDFLLGGTDPKHPTYIASPVWYKGPLPAQWAMSQQGPMKSTPASRKKVGNSDCLNNNIMKSYALNTPGGTSNEASLPGPQAAEIKDPAYQKYETSRRRQLVRQYFEWFEQQPDLEYQSIVADLKERIRHPRDAQKKAVPNLTLTDADAQQVWKKLINSILPHIFASNDAFFQQRHLTNPKNRLYWMRNFFHRSAADVVQKAYHAWRQDNTHLQAQTLKQKQADDRANRPHSPHEWCSPDGIRYYQSTSGDVQTIPADAPPRTSADADYNPQTQQWI